MTDATYNGWEGNGTRESAWATWNMALWIDNEYEIYRRRRRQVFLKPTDVEQFCRSEFPSGTPDMTPEEMDDVCWEEIFAAWEGEE